jgi:hypothetical protein
MPAALEISAGRCTMVKIICRARKSNWKKSSLNKVMVCHSNNKRQEKK